MNTNKQYHLGINLGHDRSAALVADGKIIVAIDQERLDRQKHSIGFMHQSIGNTRQIQLPHEAIQYCLNKKNLSWEDLTTITANMPGIDFSTQILKKALPKSVHHKIKTVPSHHLSHAYSAYWPSGFDEAIILSVDGTGTSKDGWTESYSLYTGKATKIKTLFSGKIPSHLADLGTLGSMYEYISKKAGFITKVSESIQIPEAGKLMGLAAYGTHQRKWSNWIETTPDSYSIQINSYDIALETEALKKLYDDDQIQKNYLKPYVVDLAYKVQQELEKAIIHLIKTAINKTGIKKVCLAGGVALNSVANYKLIKELELDDIFIFPAAGDNGIAVGNALWAYDHFDDQKQRAALASASLGIEYQDQQIHAALNTYKDKIIFEKLSDEEVLNHCAKKMAKGYIIARFEGGCEFGPRALGNRSIIADPTFNKMKDVINYRVKFRESFRPFAPVVPIEKTSEIFDLHICSPFMLMVSDIKQKYHKLLPAITHEDGTGRVQTVDQKNNSFFHALAYKLQEYRNGPAVLLNTSYNIAGQPIVETPEEAIETFLNTDIDFLSLENYWIQKQKTTPKDYEAHLTLLPDSVRPIGLKETDDEHLKMAMLLDDAIFNAGNGDGIWTNKELQQFSATYARYKSYSSLTSKKISTLIDPVIDNKAAVFLNPLGKSIIKSIHNNQEIDVSFEKLKCYSFLLNGGDPEQLRIDLHLSFRELDFELHEIKKKLHKLQIDINIPVLENFNKNTEISSSNHVFEAFSNKEFNIKSKLVSFYQILHRLNYNQKEICNCLKIDDLQHIKPTHLAYFERYILKEEPLHHLIRLFLLRGNISWKQAKELFGDALLNILLAINMLGVKKNKQLFSYVALYHVDGFFIATDHRFLFLKEDQMEEDPVMYIGSDSLGLIQTAPRYYSNHTLDLCTGSGVQAIVASRYSRQVLAIDINPRAIRFARFNAMLNGIHNMDVQLGNLYEKLKFNCFDTILANPPFVPSPNLETKFRDGGSSGEDILKTIISGASKRLSNKGQLFIVTDLVNVSKYEQKLKKWWHNDNADILLLKTADRDEILFSVPHCHHPFGQSYEAFNSELFSWIENFRTEQLTAVNFGYILIKKHDFKGGYFDKTIHNPSSPIYPETRSFFDTKIILHEQKQSGFRLHIEKSIRIKTQTSFATNNSEKHYFLTAQDNPYYCEYRISESLYKLLLQISKNTDLILHNCDHPILLNLIYSGIVKIEISSNLLKEKIEFNELLSGINQANTWNQKPNNEDIELIEFETKTTPTCLTAYLRQ
ncbi:MAG: methyltransferase [Flavobacteriaceae bacterium]|nr:methyltransferase [Flavobacteriaceae bacterium]